MCNPIIVKLKLLSLIFLGCQILQSCKKFVEVGIPKDRVISDLVFSSDQTATSAMTVIYSKMENESLLPYYIPLLTGLGSDELKNYSSQQSLVPFYTNSLTPQNGILPNIWGALYSYIYQTNAVIEGLDKSVGVKPAVKDQLTGEAKFVRAFCHFYLVNLFGNVPLITSTDYTKNASALQTPVAEVYAQIVSDLKEAQNLLNTNYISTDGISTSSERVRPNKWVATALLSKVYLFAKDWVNSEAQASLVIANTALYDTVALNNVFLKNSKEAIWQLQPVTSGYNSIVGKNFILTGSPQTNVFNCSAISDQLYNSFEPGDKRKTSWIGLSGTNYYPNKYKVATGSTVTEYSTVLRLGELYLIRAEAEANGAGTGLGGAIADVSRIRTRAGLSIYSGPLNKDSVLNEIFHERQFELFTEWGNRWMDLKRTGSIDVVMSVVAPTKGGNWNSNWQFYPIPKIELDNDPNLIQNNGYQ